MQQIGQPEMRRQASGRSLDTLSLGIYTARLEETQPMEFFSSRGALLDVIFELGTFGIDDLFTKYVRSGKGEPISKKDVESYLEELAQIRILKVSKGTFIVQPALKH